MNVLSSIVFGLLFLFSLGYSIYWRDFAEIHLSLPFLDFPIFIGEMLLAVCLTYLAIKWTTEKSWKEPWKMMVGVYLLWILVKAMAGYLTHGPLSFRNAALFYYPLFIVVGYEIYNRRFFKQPNLILGGILLLVLVFIYKQFSYYTVSYFLIGICLILAVKNKFLRGLFLVLLLVLFPINNFFIGGRAYFVGVCAVLVFLYFYCIFFLLRNRKMRLVVSILSIVLFVIGVKCFGNKNKIKSLLTPSTVWSNYQAAELRYQEKLKGFKFMELTPQLYKPEAKNLIEKFQTGSADRRFEESFIKKIDSFKKDLNSNPESSIDERSLKLNEQKVNELKKKLADISIDVASKVKTKGDNYKQEISIQGRQEINEAFKDFEKNLTEETGGQSNVDPKIREGIADLEKTFEASYREIFLNKDIQVEYENMIFRIFIWRDMIEELIQDRGWFGINWGKPQRSKRIEVSKMAFGEWSRDGWITPHDSWLHYIYRGGFIGLVFIIFNLFVFIKTVKYFILNRSVIGVLLCTIILYWFTIANFLVTFELPYNAIPVWTFLGMMLAYKKDFVTRQTK